MLDKTDIPTAVLPAEEPAAQDFLTGLADLTLKKRGPLFQLVFGSAAFCAALYLRFVVDESLPPGFPFLTFFPAVLLTAFFASVRAGVGVATAGGLAAWFFFVAPVYSFMLTPDSATAMIFYTLIVATELLLISVMNLALLRLRKSEQRSADLAKSRSLMFSELQHRVSNNLAVVAALLRLQAGRSKDPQAKQMLSDAQVRVNTIARLQRRLHSPNLQSVAVDDFIHDMAEDTIRVAGAGAGVKLHFDLQPVHVPHEKAVPLGLIVSELLMNAVEHSLGAGVGAIHIVLSKAENAQTVTLEVQDSGRGLSKDFDIAQSKSLGLSIARQFALQLAGELTLTNGPKGGTLARLEFES
jgi:two-component sensor histidine kinase